jgi:hypothetical protein
MRPSNSIWWFRLGVDFNTGKYLSGGVKLYACKDGAVKIHPCGTVHFISNGWYLDEEIESL